MHHSSRVIHSQYITHQCYRWLVISQHAPRVYILPRYEREKKKGGWEGRREAETNKDGGREGRMNRWVEWRAKEKRYCFLVQKNIYVHIFTCSYLEIIAHATVLYNLYVARLPDHRTQQMWVCHIGQIWRAGKHNELQWRGNTWRSGQ